MITIKDGQNMLEVLDVPLDDDSFILFNEPLLVPFTIIDKGTAGECYFAELKEIGISAVGVDLGELCSCLQSDICMTWKRVFRKSASKLTSIDKKIKQQFRKLAKEKCPCTEAQRHPTILKSICQFVIGIR